MAWSELGKPHFSDKQHVKLEPYIKKNGQVLFSDWFKSSCISRSMLISVSADPGVRGLHKRRHRL